ncbi:class I SAM-dependent methyltransferase [Modestobacter roseus]|uniref:Methyltransferase type 11 domain-containing protein n=1 Tax=Modestobacter roseus TaxID=1181884 RepID=A0A562ISA6_9ACTN|nr:methyltransferase domain-containing protein [Modestobacter roseus]MQA32567.1 SAM-dependent methyltransferase [Modestobacter roseus]TWH73792.1 hypothetical protein JD78_02316 [Modestobacter roseus]
MRSFEDLVAEAEAAPVDGWDFSWFAGRATEERPAWGYARLLIARLAGADTALDVQTGGGEVFTECLGRAARRPAVVLATEGWAPNAALARVALAPFGGRVHEVGERDPLPLADSTVDLVSSRHPVARGWDELARVLRPGGTYLSQGVGRGSNRELAEFLLGPQPDVGQPTLAEEVAAATAAGLQVVDAREQSTRVEFTDVGAVVHFLRKVVWTVPGFSVEEHRARLASLHDRIRRDGSFVCHSHRQLIEARRPR